MRISKGAGAQGALAARACSGAGCSLSRWPCPSSPPRARNVKIKTTDEHQSSADSQDRQKRRNLPFPALRHQALITPVDTARYCLGKGGSSTIRHGRREDVRSLSRQPACSAFSAARQQSDWKAAGSLVHQRLLLEQNRDGILTVCVPSRARSACSVSGRCGARGWESRCCRHCSGAMGSTVGWPRSPRGHVPP